MRRLVSSVAVATLTTGLLLLGPAASADVPGCPHPEEAVGGRAFVSVDPIPLGPSETVDVAFEMEARTACLVAYPASVHLVTPARTIPVEPTTVTVDREQGFTTLRGAYTIDASDLTNADAGEWLFDFAAGDVAHSYYPLNVLRRTTLTLDAGPEPLRRHHRLTFRGRLMAADWERGRYRGVPGQPLRLFAIDSQTTPVWVPFAEPTTGRHGRYRVRTTVAGPDRFQAVFLGAYPSPFSPAESEIDTVAART